MVFMRRVSLVDWDRFGKELWERGRGLEESIGVEGLGSRGWGFFRRRRFKLLGLFYKFISNYWNLIRFALLKYYESMFYKGISVFFNSSF